MTTRTIVAALLTALVAPLVLLLTATPALACSCAPQGFAAQVAGADVVFTGRAGASDDGPPREGVGSADPVTTTFAVDTVHRGDLAATVAVVSARNEASCGIGFAPGVDYLVVGGRDGDTVTTGSCTGTRPLAGIPAADLETLGVGRPVAVPVAPEAEPTPAADAGWAPAVLIVSVAAVAGAAVLVGRRLRR